MRLSLFPLQLLFFLVRSDYYAGRYFDSKNLTYAECIPKQRVYAYYGAKDEALDGRKCIKWDTVRAELAQQMQDYHQYYFPTEYEDHNQCRTVLLNQYERDPQVNNASAHSFVHFDEWRKGPWCYVKSLPSEEPVKLWFGKFTSNYRPWPCFDYCAEQKDPATTTEKPTTNTPTRSIYYNYNEELIEQLSDKFFNYFDQGNMEYYTKINRRDRLSLGFQIRRHYIFFTFLSILLTAISISIGSYIWHRCRRRSAIVEEEEPDLKTAQEVDTVITDQPTNVGVTTTQLDNTKE